MLVQIWDKDLDKHLKLVAQYPEHAFPLEVEHLHELVIAEQCDHEPESALLMLVQVHHGSTNDEVESLGIPYVFILL